MSTADRLAQELENAGAPAAMVAAAKRGHYDDYRSELLAPIGELVRDCRKVGLTALAERAIDGEFDGTKEEADAWAKTPEGREATAALKELGL